MTQLFANNAYGTVGTSLSNVATSLTLGTGQGGRFPSPTGGDYFTLTLIGLDSNGSESAWEIVKVTARSGDVLTIVRAQEGTSAAAWPSSSRVELRMTSGGFDNLLQKTGGTMTGDLTLSGTGRRIFGDFTNTGALSNRTMFQTSTVNGNTQVGFLPNGTSTNTQLHIFGLSDPTNSPYGAFIINASAVVLQSVAAGSGTALPLTLKMGATEVARVSTGANFLVGTTTDDTVSKLQVAGNVAISGTGSRIYGDFSNATAASRLAFQSNTVNGNTLVNLIPNGTATVSRWGAFNGSDPANASIVSIGVTSTAAEIVSTINGTGSYLPITVYTGGSERIRIGATSGNVLIATTTDDGVNKLQVTGGAAISGSLSVGVNATIGGVTQFNDNAISNNGKRYYWYEPGTTTWLSIYSPSLNNLDVASSGGTVARFTSGVGITVTGRVVATSGASSDTNPAFYAIGAASTQGSIAFGDNVAYRIAGGGAYGGIDIVANGTTVGHFASSGATVSGTFSATGIINTSSNGMVVASSTNTSSQYYKASNASGDFYVATDSSTGSSFAAGGVAYAANYYLGYSAPHIWSVAGAEKMRLSAAGRLGIGVSPTQRLDVYQNAANTPLIVQSENGSSGNSFDYSAFVTKCTGGASGGFVAWATGSIRAGTVWVNVETSHPLIFGTADTERARIDASGNVFVAQTSSTAGEKFGITQSANNIGSYLYCTNASFSGNCAVINATRTASSAFSFVTYYAGGSPQFSITGTGVIFAQNLTGGATTLSVDASGNIIRTPSDAKLKTNVRPLEYGLAEVRQLSFVRHGWTEESNMGEGDTVGVIADDAELVMPELVSSGGTYKSFDYAKLTAPLGKSVQQLADIIEAQDARIAQLEADKAQLLTVLSSVDNRLAALEAA